MMKKPSLTTIIALVLLAGVVLLVAVVPLLPGYDPYTQDLGVSLLFSFEMLEEKRSILGTDKLGRDVRSRIALDGQV